MLINLKLNNFRKHENREFNFGHGLHVIRGNSEAGKSTLVEAVFYALYGSRAIRNSLEKAVSWNKPVNSLKVEATLNLNGQEYTFTRSKAGAEVLKDGQVFVTGQTEVATFAEKMMGADVKTAAKLMLASQNNLRGALEMGPTATAEMVESLSDFSFFEEIIDKMGTKLSLGSDVAAKQRLEMAKERLENLDESVTDPEPLLNKISVHEDTVKLGQKELAAGEEVLSKLNTTLNTAQAYAKSYNNLVDSMKKAQTDLSQHEEQYQAALRKSTPVDTSKVKTLASQIDDAANHTKQLAVFKELEKLNKTYPEIFWNEGADELETAIQEKSDLWEDLSNRVAQLKIAINNTQSKIIKDTTCPTCKQHLANHQEILEQNQELEAKIAELEPQLANLQEDQKEATQELAALKQVLKDGRPFATFLQNNGQFLEADTKFVPFKLTWKGVVPTEEGVDVNSLKAEIADIEAKAQEAQRQSAVAFALEGTLKIDRERIEFLQPQLDAMEEPQDVSQIKRDVYDAEVEVNRLKNAIALEEREIRELQTAVALAKQEAEQLAVQKKALEEQVELYQKEVKDLAFNNSLLKKVKEARPIISNQLWNMVLASVSTSFSKMRGVASVITKEKDGFKVNGQDITSLSGSTLDLLGLSIRCSLIKLFVPNAPFLVLDEPAAACDEDRTMKLLGFVKGCDFPQTLVITHEEASSSVADHLIEV